MGKGAAHIIIFAAAGFNEFLKLRHNGVVASAPHIVHTVAVVNLFSAVKAQNDIAHLFVGKIYNVIVHKHAVCCECEAEVFALFFFYASCILHELFYNIKIHKRLAAEKINLKVAACARIFYQKVKCTFAYLKAHQRTLAVIFALACKAI